MNFKDTGGSAGEQIHSKPYKSLCESAQGLIFAKFDRGNSGTSHMDKSPLLWYAFTMILTLRGIPA